MRDIERVRDDRTGRHQHGAAARDAPHDVEAVPRRTVGVDLVAVRLEGTDHDGRLVPLPDAQGRLASPVADARREHFVQREVHRRRDRLLVHDFPREIAPAGGGHERAAHGRAHGFGREPEKLSAVGQGPADGGRDPRGIRLHGKPGDGGVDVGQRVVGLEEEVPREVEIGDASVVDLEVDDHELAARNLVLPVHDSSVRGRDSPAAHAGITPSTHIRDARSTR